MKTRLLLAFFSLSQKSLKALIGSFIKLMQRKGLMCLKDQLIKLGFIIL